MRPIGHKMAFDFLQEKLKHIRGKLDEFPHMKAEQLKNKNPNYFKAQVRKGLEVSRLGWLFDYPLKDIVAILKASIPELATFLDLGGVSTPGELREILGAALVANEPKSLKWLLDLPRDAYTNPQMEFSEAGYLLVEAMQAGAKGEPKAFGAAVQKFRDSVTPKKLKVDPRGEKAMFDPLVGLLAAIAAGDQASFDKAWAAAAESWKKRFNRTSENGNWDAILDFTALGIGKIAEKSGLKVPTTNPYAPTDLVQAAK